MAYENGLPKEMFAPAAASVLPDLTFPWETRFGLRDIEMYLSPFQKDGEVQLHGLRYLWIGTRPRSEKEMIGREARLIVREGLRDVLDWCGIPFNDEPGGEEILRRMRAGTFPSVLP